MATIDKYKIQVTVDGQDQVIDLKDKLDDLQTTLNRTATAGVAAFTALAVSAVRMADSLVDLADATGLSVNQLYQLSTALEQSGGQFDDSGRMLMAFSRSLGDVEKGSEQTIDALTKLGLSRSELENLTDEQLFKRVVDGLAGMENGFAKTDIAMQIFGKSAAGVDFKKLAEGLNKAVDPEVERNLRLAADAVDQIQSAFRELQLAALQAISPILEQLSQFEFSAEDARKAMQVLGALIAGAFAASTVIQLKKIIDLMIGLGAAIRKAGGFAAFLTGLTGVGLAAVAASAVAATAAYVALGEAMGDAADKKEKLEGVTPAAPGTATSASGKPQREVGKTPAEKALLAAQATTEEMRKQNAAALQYERTINGTIGMSQELADIKKVDAQLEQDRAKNVASYEKQIAALKLDTSGKNQAQIAELQKQQTLADEQLVAMANLKKEAIERTLAERQSAVEMQKQLTLIQQQTQQNVANAEAETMRRVIAGEITQQEANNINAINKIREEGLSRQKQLEEQIAGEKDTIRKKELQNQLDAVKQATDFAINEKRREIEEKAALEESYSAGVVKGLEQIAEQFKPINMAQKAVQDTWGSINNAIDTFVNTGKFKFSDFARSIVADLAKMIAKALIFRAISGFLGSVGIPLPGLAEGGPAEKGKPYMVGEKGPELFVPKAAGTVIPNDKLAAAPMSAPQQQPVVNNYNYNNNINAVDAKSVATLFYENRKALFGATNQARRELPYGAAA
jgi:lambda family phage tail tape measure protein